MVTTNKENSNNKFQIPKKLGMGMNDLNFIMEFGILFFGI
jgi:hypothetical protein